MPATNTWQAEQQHRRELAVSTAEALAEHLPGQWVRCDPHHHLVAIGSGDRRLSIRATEVGARFRVVITADLPEGYGTHTQLRPQQTTVAAERPAGAIAGQVRRRLLTDDYDRAIDEVQAEIEAARRQAAAQANAVAEIQSLITGARPYAHDSEGMTRFSGPDSMRGSIRVHPHARAADVKLDRVPIDLARDLAALIGQRRAKPAADAAA